MSETRRQNRFLLLLASLAAAVTTTTTTTAFVPATRRFRKQGVIGERSSVSLNAIEESSIPAASILNEMLSNGVEPSAVSPDGTVANEIVTKVTESLVFDSISTDILTKGSQLVGDITNVKQFLAVSALSDFMSSFAENAIEAVSNISPETLSSLTNEEWYKYLSFIVVDNSWHTMAIAIFTLGTWFQLAILNSPIDFSNDKDLPFQPGADTYSPEKADAFYSKRKFMVFKRVIQLAALTSSFTTGILFDWLILGKLFKDEEYKALARNEPRRAKIALNLCEKLGPTFIKLGQALSIRTDLIPEAYALELRALQDQVTPFDNEVGIEILKREFRVDDLSLIFSELTEDPVASASVGQVYKGKLAVTGKDVAVKIQRPGILAEIALDLYILRLLTPIQTVLQNAANGIPTEQDDIDTAILLVDEWGRGFVAETDYRLEAENTKNFQEAMIKRNLDAVCAPTVVGELVRDKVLVTEWVDGTRLDLDASPDVPRLCGVAVNAYLTMLLDTGVLHCDPHKGNLLRTTDGRLCILDWGMTLDVPKDLQYALLEFIAHINVEDYDAIPQDFINLGFSPPDVTAERLQASGITEGLSFTFRQLAAGGGPKKIQERVKAEFQDRYGSDLSDTELRDAARAEMQERMKDQLAAEGVDVKGVTNIMEEMSKRNRELFSLPPYVLYLARAFSTLEGIGLSLDENYSIIQECYPYLASRLFTDRNPRAKKALKAMLGLREDDAVSSAAHDPNSALALVQQATLDATSADDAKRQEGLSPAKLVEMTEGFASYTSSTTDVDEVGKGQAKAAAEFGKLFLDPKGSTLQDILVDETAKYGDALARRALRAALVENPAARVTSTILRGPKQLLGDNDAFFPSPLKSLLVDTPAGLPDMIESLVASTEEDDRIIATVEELRNAVGPMVTDGIASGSLTPSPNEDGTSSSSGDNGNVLSTVSDLLADEEARATITEQLPGILALSRRMGAGLLRRAAYRTEQAHELPEETRRQLADLNTALAEAVEPELVAESSSSE
eukprot:CAMPEP_0197176312 /NCGR_PEP_ID=MMETSP1423-20130617/2285_1 /TAXON_ID=476441 /ORGANISM="Pseudo-nitzschia heimii, Strain UNC1101" /LENGTH=1018 /DNA_ID=CAMNT_0042625679 /DNA_START=233 /DNA_END=3289 /DNA_ORIENTATION=+